MINCTKDAQVSDLKTLLLIGYLNFSSSLEGDKLSMLTRTYPHKPTMKFKLAIYSHQADSPFYVWFDV